MEATVDEGSFRWARTTFEWLEGGAFLVQRAEPVEPSEAPAEWLEHSPLPLVTIVGLDDSREEFTMLYADARGVFRVYRMGLRDGRWTLRRDAPGFSQRFTGTVADDGDTIAGSWERSADGAEWERDFDLTYTKVG